MKIQNRKISINHPPFIIAEISANHNKSIKRTLQLIKEAKKAGADAAKFQHFSADTIVSNDSFRKFKKLSHQASWKQSVYKVYSKASLNLSWTPILKKECDKIGIDFFTSPYSFDLVDHVDKYVPAYKIGSGDITWIEIARYIAKKNKPYIVATGASDLSDVMRIYNACYKINKKISLMQCNTNYTADISNLNYINLNVLKTYKKLFPKAILGLSDHTHGHATVLGAIALGARIVEKHFTLDNKLKGPDHKFSMNPKTWSEMIKNARELESSLGVEKKNIEKNEKESIIVQRRSIHTSQDLKKNQKIKKSHLKYLRPCPKNGIQPFQFKKIIGKKLKRNIKINNLITFKDLY